MFAIDFVADETREGPADEAMANAVIELDGFRERLDVPLDYWTTADYRRQWRQALARIAAGQTRSALITSMRDPAMARFIQWWPLYRDADTVVVQNQLLFLDGLAAPLRPEAPYEHVADHRTVSDDGDRISEWRVAFADLRQFLERTASHWG